MRTYTTKHTVYKFSELSEEAQENALEQISEFVGDWGWWETVYQDAENIGLQITSFDTYRREIEGKLTESMQDVCKKIVSEHGDSCGTYQLARKNMHKHGESNEEKFERDLLQEYLIMLDQEYESLTSRENLIDMIEANDYEFDENGKLV